MVVLIDSIAEKDEAEAESYGEEKPRTTEDRAAGRHIGM